MDQNTLDEISELLLKKLPVNGDWRNNARSLLSSSFKAASDHPNARNINKLSIPVDPYKTSEPSLLLHHLGSLHEDPDVKAILSEIGQSSSSPNNHMMLLIGPPGSGRTRAIYEVLCQKMGFYLTAADSGSAGSKDMSNAVDYFYRLAAQNDGSLPRSLAAHVFDCMVYARALILSAVLNATTTAVSPEEWLLIQLYTQRIFFMDILEAVTDLLVHDGGCVKEASVALLEKLRNKLGHTIPIFADDADILLSDKTAWFPATEGQDASAKHTLFSAFLEATVTHNSVCYVVCFWFVLRQVRPSSWVWFVGCSRGFCIPVVEG